MSILTKEETVYKNNFLTVYKILFNGDLSNHVKSLANNKPCVFLDSATSPSKLNEWSFLAARPHSVINYKNGELKQSGCELKGKEPFSLLRAFFQEERREAIKDLDFTPYVGGPIGFIAYDGGRYIEKIPTIAVDDLNLPDFYFINPALVLAHNLKTKELFIFFYKTDGRQHLNIEMIRNNLQNEDRRGDYKVSGPIKSNIEKKSFMEAVKKIQDHIYAGDVYQVNLSQRFERDFRGDRLSLYKCLRDINPGPFCVYMEGDGFSLLCSSPERLASLNNNKAQTRPIAGTRRRGQDETEDNYLSGHLLLDEKERAEHIMLVDLERNDLGKVCCYDSVKVDELMTLEKYSHVIHIVSNVCGRLYRGKDAFDLIRALFPGGTITGCPKVRCMEIIEEMEPTRRGPYTGSLGYFSYNGSADFNILIRTIVQSKGKAYIQAGAGIVADSKPEREYYETISKAQALFKAWGTQMKEEQWERMFT